METNNEIINKAISSIEPHVSNENKITIKGGANSKKIMINDTGFTVLIEEEITNPRIGIVLKRVNDIKANSNDAILVISRYIPAVVAIELKQKRINYLDISGNAYIQHKNLLIYIKGEKLVKLPKVKQTRAFQEAGLKMIFAFLNEPEIINKTYREIAQLTDVSLASVGYVVKELEELNFVLDTQKKRVLKNKKELLNRWIVAYHDVLRPRVLKKRMRFIQIENYNKWDTLPIQEVDEVTLWGGEPAGALVTGYLSPAYYTIYTNEGWQNLAKKLSLIPDENGDVEVLGFFWDIKDKYREIPVVPLLLVYADLIGSGNERNIETAKRIFDEKLQYIK